MEVKRYICDRCKKELGKFRGYQIYKYYQYNSSVNNWIYGASDDDLLKILGGDKYENN